MAKIRLDVKLTQDNPDISREKAKSLIMAGLVYINDQKCDKAGSMVDENAAVEVRGSGSCKYVSRGGLKLEKAMDVFGIKLDGAIAADIGASTGGFTDCMLKNGAKKVFAIDVGYGQLDWGLRNDERVVVMERTNARNMCPQWFGEPLSFASIDVSFISLKLMLIPLFDCLADDGHTVALIKPQFEAGRDKVGKNGVVRSDETHFEVIKNVLGFTKAAGYGVLGLDYSPVTGPKGNIEFLMHVCKQNSVTCDYASDDAIAHIVEAAHSNLDKRKEYT